MKKALMQVAKLSMPLLLAPSIAVAGDNLASVEKAFPLPSDESLIISCYHVEPEQYIENINIYDDRVELGRYSLQSEHKTEKDYAVYQPSGMGGIYTTYHFEREDSQLGKELGYVANKIQTSEVELNLATLATDENGQEYLFSNAKREFSFAQCRKQIGD